jgi:fused signal recognition particle receptor
MVVYFPLTISANVAHMFNFLKKKDSPDTVEQDAPPAQAAGFLSKLKQGLAKTRSTLGTGIARVFLGKKELNADLLDEIEMLLIGADVGVSTASELVQTLTSRLARHALNDTEAALDCLKEEMKQILRPYAKSLTLPPEAKPHMLLVVGINGSGKTTTIGKLAHYYKQTQKNIMLAAGDTFRAAAIEQLQTWGERNNVPVIAQQPGADTAAVAYDALLAAKARHIDLLIADTAGRLHTQSHLMAELQKIKRVLGKIDPTAPQDIFIVLDATLGQNAINQVKQFHAAIGVTGIILTKLDGTAKGGIIFAITKETQLPIYFIGVGEGIDDLRPFQADEFVDALFS